MWCVVHKFFIHIHICASQKRLFIYLPFPAQWYFIIFHKNFRRKHMYVQGLSQKADKWETELISIRINEHVIWEMFILRITFFVMLPLLFTNRSSSSAISLSRNKRFSSFIYPGTKWCGMGKSLNYM